MFDVSLRSPAWGPLPVRLTHASDPLISKLERALRAQQTSAVKAPLPDVA
jgi:hypothetical protein